jgi:hypothetical protein
METRGHSLRSICRQLERTRAQNTPLGEQGSPQPQGEPWRPGWAYQRKHRDELLPRRQDFDPPPPLWN